MLLFLFVSFIPAVIPARPGFIDTGNVEWRDCGNPADTWVTISDFDVTPKPVPMSGDMYVLLTTQLKHQLNSAVSIDALWEMDIQGNYTAIFCKQNSGTCKFGDICNFLTSLSSLVWPSGCPKQLADNGVPCTCPFNPTQINLPRVKFTNTLIPALSWVITGSHHIKLSLLDKTNSIVRGCLELYLDTGI